MRQTQQLDQFTPFHMPIGQAICQSNTKEPFHCSEVGTGTIRTKDLVFLKLKHTCFCFLSKPSIEVKLWIIKKSIDRNLEYPGEL